MWRGVPTERYAEHEHRSLKVKHEVSKRLVPYLVACVPMTVVYGTVVVLTHNLVLAGLAYVTSAALLGEVFVRFLGR